MKKGCWRFTTNLYVVTPDLDRLQVLYGAVQRELWAHSRIRINEGKTKCGTLAVLGLDFATRLSGSHE